MIIIGIDYSINYPALCICKDFKEFHWIAAINTPTTKKFKAQIEDFQLKYSNLHFITIESKQKTDDLYHVNERNKLFNYKDLIDTLLLKLKEITKDETDFIIAIEGISYGSSGNALVDICQSTGILKIQLLNQFLKSDVSNFFVFSPSNLKNAIGCKGNAEKWEIFEQFRTNPGIDNILTSDLFKLINAELDTIRHPKTKELTKKDKKTKKSYTEIKNYYMIDSPFMDMVDSYLPILKISQVINEKN